MREINCSILMEPTSLTPDHARNKGNNELGKERGREGGKEKAGRLRRREKDKGREGAFS